MFSYGLYTHISSNKSRSIVFLIGLFFLIYVFFYALAIILVAYVVPDKQLTYYLRDGLRVSIIILPYTTGFTIIWIIIGYFFHQFIIDRVTGGRKVTREQQPRLYNLLENLCISRGIPMPQLKVIESDALNAYASGLNPKQYSITVTTALLSELTDEEVEAVLGHELTHIRNGDVRVMVIAVIIVGLVGLGVELIFRSLRIFKATTYGGSSSFSSSSPFSNSSSSDSTTEKKGSSPGVFLAMLLAVFLMVFAWFLSQLIRFSLSRTREYMADAGAVELTKNPDAMISALHKIDGRGEIPRATSGIMELCFDNPRQGLADLFATHPSIESRIEALVKYAGGHDLRTGREIWGKKA